MNFSGTFILIELESFSSKKKDAGDLNFLLEDKFWLYVEASVLICFWLDDDLIYGFLMKSNLL